MAPQGLDNPAGPGIEPTINKVQVRNDDDEVKAKGCCRKFTNKINRGLENGFGKLGFTVATHPWKTILISLLVCAVCFIGVLEYQVENRGEENWVDKGSDALKHKDWVEENFPTQFHSVSIMLEDKSGNILTPNGLLALLNITERVKKIAEGKDNLQWEDICFRSSGECIPSSILELWHYNRTIIEKLKIHDITTAINKPNLQSPMTKKPMNPKLIIGGPVETDSSGNVTKAKIAKVQFKIKKEEVYDSSEGRPVDKNGEDWEEIFDKEMEKGSTGRTLYYLSEWGAGQASGDAAQGDIQFFFVGYLLVIIYLSIMLGSFTRINHKIYLAFAGITCIGLSVGVAYGLGSAFQMRKTAVHDVLAFLLLGIGVDDVFVIVQNWDNIGGPVSDGRSVPEKMSQTLRHAGVSILVTSVTDVCAFLIGSSTILPALQSFCIWCGIGILSVFLLTITFFTACLSIDAQRQEARRDACCCCITLSDSWEPMECSKKSYLQSFIKNYYARAITSISGKVIGLTMVVGLLVGGSIGLANLEQNFDWNWFLPPSTTPRQYTDNADVFFPSNGEVSNVYTGRMNYYNDYASMDKIYNTLESDKYVADGSIHSWYHQYQKWLNVTHGNEMNVTSQCLNTVTACKPNTRTRYIDLLHEFLKKDGLHYRNNIMFSKDNKVITASSIRFQHVALSHSSDEIKAMDAIKDEIQPTDSDTESNELLPFAYTFQYIGWETNKVITKELLRNVLLATCCVFLVTLFLLSHVWTALLVVTCVALALIDIAGFMHFWSLTIDTVTTIILVLAIGLTVDYSAHIAHAFMVSRKGNKNERIIEALTEIGPAVVHGGMSTFLALVLLAASESYVFFTFFKVFFLVVTFGMFHGMVFLPIILSIMGPSPYADHGDDVQERTKDIKMATIEPVSLHNSKRRDEEFVVITNSGSITNPSYAKE